MKIQITKIPFVSGEFDTEKNELICVGVRKYGEVELCLKGGMHIPIAKIKLYRSNLAVDADETFEDAYELGKEIARRFNEFNKPREVIQEPKREFDGKSEGKFKDWMIKKIGKRNYINNFPAGYSEIEVIGFVEEFFKQV